MGTRDPSHAGSWYSSNKQQLSQELDGWLAQVPGSTVPIGTVSSKQGSTQIPTPNARAIIAPHAGYSYSGAAAAWAYKSADWANAKRVFLLGPSHHYYLTGVITTGCDKYGTPLGDLTVDTELVKQIRKDWNIKSMPKNVDEDEHSLEMHLPYIHKLLSRENAAFQADPASVPLIPIMVGNTSPEAESRYGRLLAPYLADSNNLFVISSDFCHWGSRFRYTYYQPEHPSHKSLYLRSQADVATGYPVHRSIHAIDLESMDAVESGSHATFLAQLRVTGNTVCGRHPIGLFMAAVEEAGKKGLGTDKGRFKFLRYERSSLVTDVTDSSVSYCSAFAVL